MKSRETIRVKRKKSRKECIKNLLGAPYSTLSVSSIFVNYLLKIIIKSYLSIIAVVIVTNRVRSRWWSWSGILGRQKRPLLIKLPVVLEVIVTTKTITAWLVVIRVDSHFFTTAGIRKHVFLLVRPCPHVCCVIRRQGGVQPLQVATLGHKQ